MSGRSRSVRPNDSASLLVFRALGYGAVAGVCWGGAVGTFLGLALGAWVVVILPIAIVIGAIVGAAFGLVGAVPLVLLSDRVREDEVRARKACGRVVGAVPVLVALGIWICFGELTIDDFGTAAVASLVASCVFGGTAATLAPHVVHGKKRGQTAEEGRLFAHAR